MNQAPISFLHIGATITRNFTANHNRSFLESFWNLGRKRLNKANITRDKQVLRNLRYQYTSVTIVVFSYKIWLLPEIRSNLLSPEATFKIR